jgi:hypothetical protein
MNECWGGRTNSSGEWGGEIDLKGCSSGRMNF